jgi:3-oxoacyl-[acyl-carrier-protein] synthase-3
VAAVAKRLGVPEEKRISQIRLVGNTAAASIPQALARAADGLRFRVGDRVLLSAFGGGLTWGSAALRWPDLPGAADSGMRCAPSRAVRL